MRDNIRLATTLSMLAAVLLTGSPVRAEWLYTYEYRRPLFISNTCGETLLDHQVRVILSDSVDFNKADAVGNDIRITAKDGSTLIPFWIEEWDPVGSTAGIWVVMPELPAGGDTIYVYYGNPSAAPVSDGDATFDTYDGFETYAASESANPGEWARSEKNPMITEGQSGAWDDHGATFSTVIYDSTAAEFRMYYHGYAFSGTHQIGLATASDPEGPWVKYPGNPIVTPGPEAWDAAHNRVPWVWKEGAVYHMLYTGANSSNHYQVGYATSADGITWTKHPSNPVFNCPYWANNDSESWGVIKVGSEYLMWYCSRAVREMGLAVSTDLINWVPYTTTPIYASSGIPTDDRYNHYCPDIFTYDGLYYMLVCNYDQTFNYGKLYLYSCPNPYFLEADRHLVRIAHTVGPEGSWDDHETDTPFVFTLDIERSVFYNDELWCFYSSEEGSNLWKEGILIETDIAEALSDAPLTETLGDWVTEGDIWVVENPAHQGSRSIHHLDPSGSEGTRLSTVFPGKEHGAVGAWMRRTSTSAGDYDIYIYEGSTLACAAGLGRDGDFHYWDGDFHSTGISWVVDTWYLVSFLFDTDVDNFDLVVHEEDLTEMMRVEGISFNSDVSSIDSVLFYSSVGYTGDCYADDFRVRNWCGTDPVIVVGSEETVIVTDAPDGPLPHAYALYQNHPNPFNPVTRIRYYIPENCRVDLEIYDILGRKVATLVDKVQEAGERTVLWNGKDQSGVQVSSGIYLYRLRAGSFSKSRKMVLLR